MGAVKDYLLRMTKAYAECALWTSSHIDDDGNHEYNLDDHYTTQDIDLETWDEMAEDCAAFVTAARDGEGNGTGTDLIGDMCPEQCGHDFWLTRNGHGVGFRDRGLGHRGDRLTDAAHSYGEVDLYVGDDGMIHSERA